jgi:type IV secretory pathway VirB10-like protein
MAAAPNDNDDLFRRLSRPRPAVIAPDRPWPFAAGVAAIILIGLVMFLSMSKARNARTAVVAPPPTRSVVPQPEHIVAAMPEQPIRYAVASPTVVPQRVESVGMATVPDRVVRLKAPAMVVDLSQPAGGVAAAAPVTATAVTAGGAPAGEKPSSDESFATRVRDSSVETSIATHLANTALIAPQGTIIPAILETGLNSDTPGYVRAVVTRDVRGFDGSTVLIPRGSKLIGEYKSGLAQGVSRAFVMWSRVLTPDGISIEIGSPAVDSQGQGGVAGETNSHFLRRFGGAILLSVLNAGLEAAANAAYGGNSVIVSSPQQATSAASVALSKDLDIPPTVTVRQGTPIRAFVARDLDFSGVMTATPR